MSDERFDLVFDGRLASGFSQAQVRQNMAELFNLGEAQLAALFSGRVVVLKRGLDKGQAIRFRNRLAQAGALGLIRPAEAAQPETSAAPAAVAPAPKPAVAARPVTPKPKPQPAPAAAAPSAAAAAPVVASAARPAVATPPAAEPVAIGDLITCPRCGHEQARSNSCSACRMDLRLHLQRLEKRARLVALRRG